MDDRKQQILQLVVENYTQTAEPVGSKFLVENCDLGVSGATARNEMRDLEQLGFLTHPHTSSGRMPTEAGYQYYIENIMKPEALNKKIKDELETSVSKVEDKQQKLKVLGKQVAEKVQNAVIVAFGESSLYYTGISNLFSQPEFRDYAYTVSVSTIFDQVEERIENIFELFNDEKPLVLIGEKNPFGNMCGLVGGRLNGDSLFAILGPLRMDYALNYSFVDYLQEIL